MQASVAGYDPAGEGSPARMHGAGTLGDEVALSGPGGDPRLPASHPQGKQGPDLQRMPVGCKIW